MAIKLTKQQQQVLAAGVLGLGAFVYCYVQFFWLPISKKTKEIRTEIEALEREIETAKRQAGRLADLDRQLISLNERKIEAEKRLPKKKAVTDILVTLDAVASQYNVVLLSFAPGPNKPAQYFTEFRFPISVRGTFHNIGRFLASLALEQRLYNVYDVKFPEPTEGSGEMRVNLILVAYQYKEG
ncbi:MAG: type 4a pilus biogenesis protein PilO [Elusimicrobia bacterium]|jgi:Tfp pilus assembly protein PilO|nr:type 4a pilus biogenesis protein PilO [Elusimicrobiota bacterium]